MSMFDELPYTTTRIEAFGVGGRSVGSGFYFILEYNNNKFPVVVTNKHVISGAQNVVINISLSEEFNDYMKYIPVTINNIQDRSLLHPEINVDLAAFLIGDVMNDLIAAGAKLKTSQLGAANIPTPQQIRQLTSIEEVLMIGYPTGLWDRENNFPIVRRGITATPYAIDHENRAEFMIDAACFPGSSGSPVMIANAGSYASKDGGIIIGNRFHLLGLLWGGPQHTAEGDIVVVPAPTSNSAVALSRIPTNLGYCVKARKILDLAPQLSRFIANPD